MTGREELDARPLGQLHDLIDDLIARLRAHLAAATVAVRLADARVEQPQIVVDLGDRPDGRARIARGRLLVDRDRRREPLDVVDVRLLHLPQELASVGRERLDVAALPFGVDRVEGERRLPRTGQPGDDDEPVPRERQVDVLEVMLARALDNDRIEGARGDAGVMRWLDPLRAANVSRGQGPRSAVRGRPRKFRYSPTTTKRRSKRPRSDR